MVQHKQELLKTVNEALQKLIEGSPEVWNQIVQEYSTAHLAEAGGFAVITLVLLGFAAWLTIIAKKWLDDNEEDWASGCFLGAAAALLSSLLTGGYVIQIFAKSLAPSYHILKELL